MAERRTSGAGRRRIIGTIRLRITTLAAVALVVVLGGTAIALLAVQRQLLLDRLDAALDRRASEIATAIPPTSGADADQEQETFFQVVDSHGTVVAATAGLATNPVGDAPPDGRDTVVRTIGGLAVDEGDFRVLSRRVDDISGYDGPLVVHVGETLDDIHESTGVLARGLAVIIPIVALVLAALVWWLVGRTIRPVESIRAEVASIGGAELHRRVPEPPGDDEIARLAQTMNTMLARVEESSERQRRFVADASHELRSPLTRIRSELEVDAAHPETADPSTTHRRLLAEIAHLQRLIDDLLHLARSDAGGPPLRRAPVDLDDVVLREAAGVRASGSSVPIDLTGVSAAQVAGDARQLARVVANLLDNAVRHARTTVTVSLGEHDGDAVLAVHDDGPGIPADRQAEVFVRFARLDDDRNPASGGTGLGLAIVHDIVARHGGTVAVDPSTAVGARLVVVLPRLDGQ